MYRQAAIIALEETLDLVADYMPMVPTPHSANVKCRQTANDIKARAITGINIAKRLLEESGSEEECEVHIIQMDSETPDPFKTMLEKLGEEMQAHKADKPNKCPRCGTQIAFPDTKVCWFCGMALMADKGAE